MNSNHKEKNIYVHNGNTSVNRRTYQYHQGQLNHVKEILLRHMEYAF